MFRASSAHLQEDTVVHMQHRPMVLLLSMRFLGGLSVHSLNNVLRATCCNHLYSLELLMMGIILPETC